MEDYNYLEGIYIVMIIQISKLTDREIADKNVHSWPIWTCAISEFDWEYDERECCYLLDGEVEVSSDYETVAFGAGDFIVFPKSLKCRWKVTKPVRKHYSFG